MDIKTIQSLVYREYKKNEYEYMWNLEDLRMLLREISKYSIEYFKGNQFKQLLTIADVAEIGLINTEVSELLEDVRKDRSIEKQAEELADITIRVMNYCNRKGIDLESAILKKHEKNMGRESLHGKLV